MRAIFDDIAANRSFSSPKRGFKVGQASCRRPKQLDTNQLPDDYVGFSGTLPLRNVAQRVFRVHLRVAWTPNSPCLHAFFIAFLLSLAMVKRFSGVPGL
jgi:hypothetical protein